MGNAVCAIVEASIGSRSYEKALKVLSFLREHCVTSQKAEGFNTILHHIRTKYKDGLQHNFWISISQAGISLINEQDYTGAGVRLEDAKKFIAQASRDNMVQEDACDTDEDELEGME